MLSWLPMTFAQSELAILQQFTVMLLCPVLMLMLCACFDIVLYLDALVFFPVASMIMYQCSCAFSCYSHALSCSHVLSCCSCDLSCFCALSLMLLCFFPAPIFCLNIPVLCPTFIFCLDAPMLFPTPVLCPHALSCPVPCPVLVPVLCLALMLCPAFGRELAGRSDGVFSKKATLHPDCGAGSSGNCYSWL